jgi:hypothetical protein
MESTAESRWPLAWKLSFFVPVAVALVLMLISRTQTNLHRQIELTVIGNIFGVISLIAQAVYWIVVKKWTGWGIAMLIFMSAVLGFGLHTLLRVR